MLYNHNQQLNKLKRAQQILTILKNQGFEAFIVGGAVRDFCLRLPFQDIDITTNANFQHIQQFFSLCSERNIYGSYRILFEEESFDIATYRKEGSYLDHRHPSSIEFTNDIKDDILRRDFTINALLMDEKKNIIDYVDGLNDLMHHRIKAIKNPNQKLKEDALRIMKLFYLQAKLNFNIETRTYQALILHISLLKKLKADKILQEILKILNQKYWKRVFISFQQTKALTFLNGFAKGILFVLEHEITHLEEKIFLGLSFILDQTLIKHFPFDKKRKKIMQHIAHQYFQKRVF
ncbi:CCA tRNA nucleotidyltransferase [Candidatus Phytoplasma phoenicium]|uniref:CCA-adding enzyme (TRNA adenylyl-/cytidylyl-transferase) (TRNA CCA-pyrophosphorylase) n=1 Tax=Candidatus Phytoplasma phoenicium TaxID=198422 RepID=A0A0L0MJY6_9MOLU|nr:CCA tRNA nucleotidyltransferase [Candidatus Phytoplasma phoenicium]KND62561.1 CCA-adding enzyme (tRNA adenylyl-/cytidylyl-transferase) (tRNA CCA-pyrophosphorylase) [Candidatus Phytoplasma phoenicium]